MYAVFLCPFISPATRSSLQLFWSSLVFHRSRMRWIHLGLFGALSSTGASLDLFGKKREGHVNAVNSLLLTDIRYLAPVEVERINQTTPNLAARHLFHVRQNTGRCGADFGGARCPDSQCCSAYGYCGTAYEHCAELVGWYVKFAEGHR